MKLCFLANIGQRDLSLDGQPIPRHELRSKGAELRDLLRKAPNSVLPRLDAPILLPALRFLLQEVHINSEVRVWLFGTDQGNAEFQPGDTCHVAEALALFLKNRFAQNQLPKVSPVSVRGSPNEYDTMLEQYGHRLSHLDGDTAAADRIYVLLAGGTPACNTALLLSAAKVFQERVEALLVKENSSQVVPLKVVSQILDSYRSSQARKLVERFDFAGLVELTDAASPAGLLSRHAAARAALDLDSAWSFAHQLAQTPCRDLALELRGDIEKLRKKDPLARLQELWMHWDIAFARGNYLLGVQILFRLFEASARWKVETELNLDTDDRERFEKGVDAVPALASFLDNYKLPKGGELRWRNSEPNLETLGAVLRYLAAGGARSDGKCLPPSQQSEISQALSLWDVFNPLKSLRNKSLFNHGFDGVSLDSIRTAYPGDLHAGVKTFIARLGAPLPPCNRFTSIQEHLMKLLP